MPNHPREFLEAWPRSVGEPAEPDPKSWFAIHTRSKHESVVSSALHGKGYQEFLPLYRVRRCWSHRTAELDVPLFPGYLFCRFDPNGRILPILTTPGVVSIVGAGRVPIPVPADEIAAIHAVLRSGLAAQPYPYLKVGSRVYLESGPFAGIEGIVLNVNKKYRLVVSVTLLQRSVAVEIDRDWIRPVANARGPASVASTRN